MVEEAYKVAEVRSPQCEGSHGYDIAYLCMRTIFIGARPQFDRGRKIPSFENIELYEVMTSILGLKAAPNNGTSSLAKSLLLPFQ
jgi:ectonucleotide pyrophosphatase/phosphodiesterase family protein 1/3